MKQFGLWAVLVAALTLSVHAAEGDGFKPLFNGKDLTGWDGNTKLWTVKDGVIVGETTKEVPTKGNTFLIYKGEKAAEFKDFELKLKFRMSKTGNSGIQYRSKIVPGGPENNWVLGGYQYDISNEGWLQMGKLYEERGKRGRMNLCGEKVVWGNVDKKPEPTPLENLEQIKTATKVGEWNDAEIIAKGNHIIHKLNGIVIVDFTDNHDKFKLLSGIMGLQIHAGAPMKVEFKDIEIKEGT